MALSQKSCTACKGEIPPLKIDEIRRILDELGNGWTINEKEHLEKTYSFDDFKSAMEKANTIARIAEHEQHHPDLYIAWGKCRVEIWTHKVNGLTESDFILAAKIEESIIAPDL